MASRKRPFPIRLIDTYQFGVPRTGAAYWMDSDSPALIEAGTAASAAWLLASLRGAKPTHLFLTHIHLDHAGGAGHLARAFPDCRVIVHLSGLRHLTRPEPLLRAVQAASPDLFPLYGRPLPIPERQIVPVSGGEVFDLGARRVEVVSAPGHAPHHLCYLEHSTRTLFVGDAVGAWCCRPNVPLTVPPRFDLESALQTLDRIEAIGPKTLAYSHFGLAHEACSHAPQYKREVQAWFESIDVLLSQLESDKVMHTLLKSPLHAGLSILERASLAMCVRGAIATLRHEHRVPSSESSAI